MPYSAWMTSVTLGEAGHELFGDVAGLEAEGLAIGEADALDTDELGAAADLELRGGLWGLSGRNSLAGEDDGAGAAALLADVASEVRDAVGVDDLFAQGGGVQHVGAASLEGGDDAALLELAQGLLHRGEADAEVLGEGLLGGELVARRESARADLVLENGHDLGIEGLIVSWGQLAHPDLCHSAVSRAVAWGHDNALSIFSIRNLDNRIRRQYTPANRRQPCPTRNASTVKCCA